MLLSNKFLFEIRQFQLSTVIHCLYKPMCWDQREAGRKGREGGKEGEGGREETERGCEGKEGEGGGEEIEREGERVKEKKRARKGKR